MEVPKTSMKSCMMCGLGMVQGFWYDNEGIQHKEWFCEWCGYHVEDENPVIEGDKGEVKNEHIKES